MQRSARIDLIKRGVRTKAIRRNEEIKDHYRWKIWFINQQRNLVKQNSYVREERQARRDDWLAGPLAPNRNIGKAKGTYGTLDSESVMPAELPKRARTMAKRLTQNDINDDGSVSPDLAFKGKTIIGNVIENDRVVVVAGSSRIKGLVGTVKSIGTETETVILQDINIADLGMTEVQKAFASTSREGTVPFFETSEVPIPLKDVRLVYDIVDPRTRRKKAVIIRHVHADGPYSARSPFSSWPSHTRYATGTGHLTRDGQDIRLDWPEEVPGEVPRRLAADTSRTKVEDVTWQPAMDHSPLGYPTDQVEVKGEHGAESPEGRYTAGIPPVESDVRFAAQRLGLHGFVNTAKLDERQQRIANGIMAELHGSARILKQDRAAHLKQKILEDARAIWWQERQFLSPAAEAAKKAAEANKQRREAHLPKTAGNSADSVVDSGLLEQFKTVSVADRYKNVDRLLSRHLSEAKKIAGDAPSPPLQKRARKDKVRKPKASISDVLLN